HAVRAIALEAKLLECGAAQLARATFDGAHDVVLWHVDVASLLHGQAETIVAFGVPPTRAGGDGDLSGHLGELLALLGVGEGLLVLDRRPLGMSRHLLPVEEFSSPSAARLDAVRVARPSRRWA